MRISEHLILANGKDITANVKFCKYNPATKKYDVVFLKGNGMKYSYDYTSLEWVREPKALNPALAHIWHGEQYLSNLVEIRVFSAGAMRYWYVRFSNGTERRYPESELTFDISCLQESEAMNSFSYLREMAAMSELENESGQVLLQKQYENLDFISTDAAMALYLNPKQHAPRHYKQSHFIFPFGGNESQFKAVQAALCNQLSIIQGPPGTGKTQTILNIIANFLVEGKSVQIVSGNNSATENVLEKLALPRYNMGFLVAPLGKSDNKKDFIEQQNGKYPDIAKWERDDDAKAALKEQVKALAAQVAETFAKQERLALVRQEQCSLALEMRYFEQYCAQTDGAQGTITPRRPLKSETLLRLWRECDLLPEERRSVSFWFKIKSAFFYRIANWKFYDSGLDTIVTVLQNLFYKARNTELCNEIAALEQHLAAIKASSVMDELTQMSMEYLRAILFERYGKKAERRKFSEEDLWKNGQEVVEEYPVVLSTTFSSRSCLKNVAYDVVIMDEASQVDVATGALALSGAKNAVIVGDLKQLPNVVKGETKRRSDAVFASYQLPQAYSFSQNSFLKSVCELFPEAPQTLLREHYRCHPKIIEFCNQKFYGGELVIMTQDRGEQDALAVCKTSQGNHRRDRVNQRQIDVALQEALPLFSQTMPEEIGVIAPYRGQVTAMRQCLPTQAIEVDTVHKFQGREKDVILLTTVDDTVTDFSDDPYLLNVAISRAKKKFCLVVSGNEQPTDSNVRDLIEYIEYNNFKVVDSEVYSVFDLLYRQYTQERLAFLQKHRRVSAYDSENLMYGVIADLLQETPQLPLGVICHQPLRMLLRNTARLSEEDRRYVAQHGTHLDFLLYDKITKKPVLAIEVDGFHHHKPGTAQHERDQRKDAILACYGIACKRFATNGSGEIAWLKEWVKGYQGQ